MAQIKHHRLQKKEQGFALLMTLIVVTVVIAIGITVLDLSTKQIRLSTNAKDSEIAFHAANAGMECARYVRKNASTLMENGQAVTPACFGGTLYSNSRQELSSPRIQGDGRVFRYDYAFTWASNSRCTEITTLVASSTDTGSPTLNDVVIDMDLAPEIIDGYPESTKTCAVGEKCTVISVRGYNKPCGPSLGYGTIEREVLLQF